MTDKEKELIEQVALTYGYSYEEINYHYQKMKQVFVSVLEIMREMVNTLADLITRDKNKIDYNWHIPLDTTRLSQVRVPNVQLPRIRSLI